MDTFGLADDARLAVRLWIRRPALALVALLTIALGVGAPTAMFSVLHAVLLQPLPYPHPERIVSFHMESHGRRGPIVFDALPASTAAEWMLSTSTLTGISLYNDRALTLSTGDGPFRLTGTSMTPGGFDLLGVPPIVGRTFDATTTDARQIVLSHDAWQRFFAGRREIAGTSITLDGEAYLVTGVMPADFDFPTAEAAFWVPLLMPPGGTRGMLLPAIAQMRADSSLAAVEEEGRRLLGNSDGPGQELTLQVRSLHDQLVGRNRRLLWILMGAVSLVSIIATTNLALLLLVRGAARAREFSIRLATGAPRTRILRQLMVEAATLATIGGAAGVALAALLLTMLLRFAPADVPRLQDASMNGPVLLFALALIAATSTLFGVLSAGRALTVDVVRALASTGGESAMTTPGSPRRRLNVLAIAEVGLTIVLLIGSGLLLRSFLSLLAVDHGFDPSRALALQITLPSARYRTPADRLAFHDRLLERLNAVPGIDAAGIAVSMPNRQPSARFAYDPVSLPDVSDPTTLQVAEVRMVSEGFIAAMGLRLLAGRGFRASDADGAEPVIVISESLSRLHFKDDNAVGRMLYSGSGTCRVIGVVADVRSATRQGEPAPSAYLPTRQSSDIFQWFGTLTVVLRADDPVSLAPTMRALVLSLDPEMPPFNVRTLDQEVSRLVAGPRFSASALTGFGVVALALAAIGLYGVMSYAAGQRTHEFGVRIALGATRRQVLWLVMREGMLVLAAGVAAGLVAAVWLAQTLASLLHDVQPAEPLVLASAAALIAGVGLIAVFVPAHRATRISAVQAIRGS